MKRMLSMAVAALVLAAGAAPVAAQYRGEEILGKIQSVDGTNVVVRRDGGQEVRITIGTQTEVFFQDSGDRKLFPNPSYRDLKAGMGVKFTYNDGNPARIVVNYVPASTGSGTAVPLPAAASQQVKARIQSVSGGGIQADVAGASRTYPVEGAAAGAARRGQLVVLTVENRNGQQVVTRIDPADAVGTVVRKAGKSVTIDANGAPQAYAVDDEDLLDNVRNGQRVRFEFEERSNGRKVITAIRPE
jgi:hypothetical protein